MKVLLVFAAVLATGLAQYLQPEQYAPIPYSFNYNANTDDGGSSGHQEQGDGSGRVTGSYTVNDLEGHTRVVEYVADENGFRATVRTNEPGTANLNPADVIMESSAPDAGAAGAYSTGGAYGGAGAYGAAGAYGGAGGGGRYVLVPSDDPRARGYY